jgi:hypothetical protein
MSRERSGSSPPIWAQEAECGVAIVRQKGTSCNCLSLHSRRGALHRTYSDGALRHVYPLSGYRVECASDYRHLWVTLAANDGFDVVFGLNIGTAAALARDLAGSGSLLAEAQPILPN